MADTVVQELVVNTLTQAQFDAAKEAGTLSPYELYGTPDTSVRLPVLTWMWFDHIVNDVSWLRTNTFSWQSGDKYVAAYEHLVADLDVVPAIVVTDGSTYPVYVRYVDGDVSDARNPYCWRHSEMGYVYTSDESPSVNDYVCSTATGASSSGYIYSKGTRPSMFAQTDTIGDITITYYLAEDGHKICLPDQEANIAALYEATGKAWYYILDVKNKQFKLPRSKHNAYAETVPVVGNGMTLGLTNGTTTAGMYDASDSVNLTSSIKAYGTDTGTVIGSVGGLGSGSVGITTDPTKSGIVAQQTQDTDQYKYLYFYVGNFEQDSVEQTAGINAEMFNGKADVDLKNIPANYDYVVESQLPTEENGYTWYRKYKSGWVEQGGHTTTNGTIVLPVAMLNTNYNITMAQAGNTSAYTAQPMNVTTTGFDYWQYQGVFNAYWHVCGIAA